MFVFSRLFHPVLEALRSAWSTLAWLIPVLLAIFLIGVFLSFFILRKDESRYSLLPHSFVFGLIAAVVAYLNVFHATSSLEQLLPHIVILAAFFSQLLGRLSPKLETPIIDRASLIGSGTAAFVFIFADRYFDYWNDAIQSAQ